MPQTDHTLPTVPSPTDSEKSDDDSDDDSTDSDEDQNYGQNNRQNNRQSMTAVAHAGTPIVRRPAGVSLLESALYASSSQEKGE